MSSLDDSSATEQWRPIPGYEGVYEVSDIGRVRSLDRVVAYANGGSRLHPGKLLRQWAPMGQNGYKQTCLCRFNKRRFVSIHRLVLLAFVGPCPEGMEACHGNDIPDDNRLSNLRWDTRKANVSDRVRRYRASGFKAKRSAPMTHCMPSAPKTHCKRGHEFTPENTYLRPTGRECKECRAVHMRNWRTRKAAA